MNGCGRHWGGRCTGQPARRPVAPVGQLRGMRAPGHVPGRQRLDAALHTLREQSYGTYVVAAVARAWPATGCTRSSGCISPRC